jgi:hypothetical protein
MLRPEWRYIANSPLSLPTARPPVGRVPDTLVVELAGVAPHPVATRGNDA